MKQERQPKTVVYLSGRITGLPMTYVRDLFQRAEEHYTSEGYKVLTPLRNGLTETATWEQHMAKDIIMLQRADIIALLPGWEKSTGARLEHEIAKVMNMGVMHYEPEEKVRIGIEVMDNPEFVKSEFRYEIAKMENLTPGLVNILSKDESCVVRWTIAERDELDAEQIDRLTKDEDWHVRWTIAQRSDLTAEQIERLLHDEDVCVREVSTLNAIKRSTK